MILYEIIYFSTNQCCSGDPYHLPVTLDSGCRAMTRVTCGSFRLHVSWGEVFWVWHFCKSSWNIGSMSRCVMVRSQIEEVNTSESNYDKYSERLPSSHHFGVYEIYLHVRWPLKSTFGDFFNKHGEGADFIFSIKQYLCERSYCIRCDVLALYNHIKLMQLHV